MFCNFHNLKIIKVCLISDCKSNLLCQKCEILHQSDHYSHQVDFSFVFDSQNNPILMQT